jgi:hypothetical protein
MCGSVLISDMGPIHQRCIGILQTAPRISLRIPHNQKTPQRTLEAAIHPILGLSHRLPKDLPQSLADRLDSVPGGVPELVFLGCSPYRPII